jgi:hypothetical protein
VAVVVNLEGLPGIPSNQGRRRGTLTLGVYATGGVPVTAAQFHLATLDHLELPLMLAEFDKTNLKIQAYQVPGAPGALSSTPFQEYPAGIDLSGLPIEFRAEGEEN